MVNELLYSIFEKIYVEHLNLTRTLGSRNLSELDILAILPN